jgi:hypothetical protein
MANVDGEWDCVTRTPMGDQKSVFTVISNGGTFTGTNAGPLGALDILDGKVDGDDLTWKMEMKMPFPMTLDCKATVTGDSIEGGVTAGAFGTSPMSGTRKEG